MSAALPQELPIWFFDHIQLHGFKHWHCIHAHYICMPHCLLLMACKSLGDFSFVKTYFQAFLACGVHVNTVM